MILTTCPALLCCAVLCCAAPIVYNIIIVLLHHLSIALLPFTSPQASMPLPTFKSVRLPRRRVGHNEKSREDNEPVGCLSPRDSDITNSTTTAVYRPSVDLKRATRNRRNAIIASMILYFIAIIFLILVVIGNINQDAVIRDTWFIQINVSNIFSISGSQTLLLNSIARSVGLHDFYQIGLWNFCEGYNDVGLTDCSKPQSLYWCNPVKIILSELLAGATVQLPAEINSILDLIKLASHLMFGFFITGTVLNFVCIFVSFVALFSRWWSFALALLTFVTALLTVAATIIATVMFVIFRNVITSEQGLNIEASIGNQMFAFMWIASACTLAAFVIHLSLTCCCASRRDVITGRRTGSKKAYGDHTVDEQAKPSRMKSFLSIKKKTDDQL